MPRQRVEAYIACPAIVPYPVLSVLGHIFKWCVILTCLASVAYTTCGSYRTLNQVLHNPLPAHAAPLHRHHTIPTLKGHRL